MLRAEMGNYLFQVHGRHYRHMINSVSMGVSGKIYGMSFGSRIRDLRVSLGLTQIQLSARAGITQGSLSSIERGDTKGMKSETILNLARALGTSPEYLQTGKGPLGGAAKLTADELAALQLFQAPSPASRAKWLSNGRWLLAEEATTPPKVALFKLP